MIGYKIGRQNYELILERIGAIIAIELENQASQFYNTDCENIKIFLESLSPVNKSGTDIINVSLAPSTYGNRNVGYVDGVYSFFVDVYTNSKTIGDEDGGKISSLRAHRIMGILRAILEDPIYKTLGFTPGTIGNVRVTGFEVGSVNGTSSDAVNTKIDRLLVEVKAGEITLLPEGNLLTTALTQVYLEETADGYMFQFGPDNTPPPLDKRFVYITDQDGNILELVAGGHKYSVTVMRSILQTLIKPPPATIIQTIT